MTSPTSRPLTNFPYDPILDLAPWVGQRQASYRFQLLNGVTGENKGFLNPVRGSSTLSHDTTKTVKRTLTMGLGVDDAELVDPITDKVVPTMVMPNGQEYSLGKYVFTSISYQQFTSGYIANANLNDEMFIIDQQITRAFSTENRGIPPFTSATSTGIPISTALRVLLKPFDFPLSIEGSEFGSRDSWTIGTMRGSIVEALALAGDYFSPWFSNEGVLTFIRAFNPAYRIPDLDWNTGDQVIRSSILKTSDVLNAPNRFVVTSNAPSNPDFPTYASADVPTNAPHSVQNRGFVVAEIHNLQALNDLQCGAMAQNLVQRQSIFETYTVTTAPDPRHDSYNVIRWQGDLWLEVSWSMGLSEGAPMSHTIRRAFK